ncbi:MAG TPA: isoprenylcysteine carboxylmethyltransferase family protein [Rhizomicrobium sp.]
MRHLFTLAPLGALTAIAASTLYLAALMARRDGVKAIVLPSGDDAHAFIGGVFKVFIVLGAAFCVAYAINPSVTAWLGPLDWLVSPAAAWTGLALMAPGTVLVVAAQLGMGKSWRVGIDRENRTGLVSTGLYRFSRNPIYVGMIMIVTGVCLVAPNAVTLAMLAVVTVTVSTQVRLEEEYLSRMHGAAYAAFRTRTRRWI